MKRRDLLKTIIGFVGTLGTTKIVAEPKDIIQQDDIKTKPISRAKEPYKPYNIRHAIQPYHIFTINNCELEVFDIVYKDKDGRITTEEHGNPFGRVTQTTIDCIPNVVQIELYANLTLSKVTAQE